MLSSTAGPHLMTHEARQEQIQKPIWKKAEDLSISIKPCGNHKNKTMAAIVQDKTANDDGV